MQKTKEQIEAEIKAVESERKVLFAQMEPLKKRASDTYDRLTRLKEELGDCLIAAGKHEDLAWLQE